jgi:hypothetical protein
MFTTTEFTSTTTATNMPNCTTCGEYDRVTEAIMGSDGTYFCSRCLSWFTPVSEPDVPEIDQDADELLADLGHALEDEQDERNSLEDFLIREYQYHQLRADEIKDRLYLNGIEVSQD